ncbi:MAG: GTPase HflX [Planctomycetes bacterium]|nr:GTPase HflX [Planctomycetota bacterium]
MNKLIRTDLAVSRERALLVCIERPDSRLDPHDPLGELRSLAKTAGALVVDEMFGKRRKIDPAYYVGSGKAEEIAERAEAAEADVVIFDNDLSPAQVRDLEGVIDCKVLDRSELILDIFASRAQTHQARLQVELAQLEYTYPRLRHMWTHLERIAGGAAAMAGIGTRGPGEKQIETDRRLAQRRVTDLKRAIAQIDQRKVRTIQGRSEMFRICLVGYTNAGKSTLMNLLTDAGVLTEDRLFATLDTKTRKWRVGPAVMTLLSDTVGFVRDLPHHLVASFRATLEEAINADLLLHVADASHADVENQIKSVFAVLAELGCKDKDQILLLNKADRVKDPAMLTALAAAYRGSRVISAVNALGIEEMIEDVLARVERGRVSLTLRADFRNGRLMQYLAQHAELSSHQWGPQTVDMQAVMAVADADRLAQFVPDVRVLDRSAVDE